MSDFETITKLRDRLINVRDHLKPCGDSTCAHCGGDGGDSTCAHCGGDGSRVPPVDEKLEWGMVRAIDVEMPTKEEWSALETKYRIGADHAATRLAEALDEATSLDQCRAIANAFANLVQEGRIRDGGDFDLYALISRATAESRN